MRSIERRRKRLHNQVNERGKYFQTESPVTCLEETHPCLAETVLLDKYQSTAAPKR